MDAGGVVARSGIVRGLLGAVGGGSAAAGFVSTGMRPGFRGGRSAAVAPLRVGVAVGRPRTPMRPAPSVICTGANGGVRGAASGGRRRVKVNSQSNLPSPAETPREEPKRPSAILQALNKAVDYLTTSVPWKTALGLILFTACTILGYYGAKDNQKANFAINVLDKTNKTYKPALEFAVLLTKFVISLIKRYS